MKKSIEYFGSPACGPCRVLYNEVWPVLQAAAGDDLAFTNVNEAPTHARRCKVTKVPTVVLFADGVEVDRFEGADVIRISVNDITEWVQS